jgi:outer membrane protein assembly factor BamB
MPVRKPIQRKLVYVGINGCVVALDQESGRIFWRHELRRGGTFCPVMVDGSRVFATSGGEISCLDAATGGLLWHNSLKGYGVGYAMLAGASSSAAAAVEEMEQAVAAAAAASSAASGT